jgi:hypothetical protein
MNDSFGSKFQFDVYRLDVFNSVFDQLISDSKQLGSILNRIKTEYDDYLFYLLRNQQLTKQNSNNSFTDLSDIRIEYSNQYTRINALDNEINSLNEKIKNFYFSNSDLNSKIKIQVEFKQKANANLTEPSKFKKKLISIFKMKKFI